MSLERIEIDFDDVEVPADVAGFLADAKERIDTFVEYRGDRPIPGFVPSNFTSVFKALRMVTGERLANGGAFLEWGSGFGVVCALAAMQDYDAFGIEIERPLIEQAEELVEAHEIPVTFVCGNFVPPEGEALADTTGEFDWLQSGGGRAYEEMGLEVEDFDVIFAYPWPGEEEVVMNLFDAFAAPGALLLTYHGEYESIRIQRKRR